MKIAVVTSSNPLDKRVWSGTPYYMVKALQKHCGDISYIGPINSSLELLGRVFSKFIDLFFKKKYDYKRSIVLARRYSKIVEKRISNQKFNFIFAPAAAAQVAFLDTGLPIVLAVDTTFSLMRDYYPGYLNLLDISVKEANTIARLAIKRASLALYSSEWAAQSAINDYRADSRKVHVIPFGANLDDEDIPPRDMILRKKKSGHCHMLFLGVDWNRKGGEIAFETLLELDKLGIKATLTVCGCVPPPQFSHERMTVIPFLDKNDRGQRKALSGLFLRSDFLLLPTRSEAYGLVLCEGNAFGLPAITTNTGGVPGIVRNEENGYMLPIDARGDQYANLIAEIFDDDYRYAQLLISSRRAFEQRLNWEVWGASVKALLDTIV